jgi:hypothetical protein
MPIEAAVGCHHGVVSGGKTASGAGRAGGAWRRAVVVTDLSRLHGPTGGVVELPHRLFWQPDRRVNLDNPAVLAWMYETVLREAVTDEELCAWLDEQTLRRLWDDLFFPVACVPRGSSPSGPAGPGCGVTDSHAAAFQRRVATIALAACRDQGSDAAVSSPSSIARPFRRHTTPSHSMPRTSSWAVSGGRREVPLLRGPVRPRVPGTGTPRCVQRDDVRTVITSSRAELPGERCRPVCVRRWSLIKVQAGQRVDQGRRG